jgi:DNA-directed RNA polymerase I, II, and III subunit RPABC2
MDDYKMDNDEINESGSESGSESENETKKRNESDSDVEVDDSEEDIDSEADSEAESEADADASKVEAALVSDDDDNDEEDLDENYLQKLDKDVNRDIIANYHPEILSHNVEEVETACRIVRDENGTIVDPLHRTLSFVTRYEKARVLGERAKQINSGAHPFIPVDNTLIDGYLIALQEFEQKKIPFIIRRPLPNGCSEYWKLSDLDIL